MSAYRVIAAFAVLFAAGAQAQERIDPSLAEGGLAVLDFKNKLSSEDSASIDPSYFADVARSAALKALPGLKVFTRENLLVLLQATSRNASDCEGECEIETGRKIGADLVISGDLLRIGTSFKLNLRLHETHGGQLLDGEVASGKTVDELDTNTAAAVYSLLAPLGQASAAQRNRGTAGRAVTTATPEQPAASGGGGSLTPAPARPRVVEVAPIHQAQGGPRVFTWVAGGAAVLSIGVGVALGVSSQSTANEISATVHSGAEVQQLDNSMKSKAQTANILLGVGVGLAVVSASLFIFHF